MEGKKGVGEEGTKAILPVEFRGTVPRALCSVQTYLQYLYVLLSVLWVLCFCIVLRIVSIYVYSCVLSICV
jgi:hypothetical protein